MNWMTWGMQYIKSLETKESTEHIGVKQFNKVGV